MKQIVTGFLLLSLYWSMFVPFAMEANAQALTRAYQTKMEDTDEGLEFRLSEGKEMPETSGGPERPDVETRAMSPGETAQLLGRLGEIKKDPADQTDFSKREGSLPAPKKGEKIPVPFPADSAMVKPESGAKQPLVVVRSTPEGDVPLAPDLSVTSSHPMVAVTSQQEAAEYAPVEISPRVEGKWRWLGTKTLRFDTTKRFPMATEYKVRVPAGTKSATGETLAKDVEWTFTTPPPKLIDRSPYNNQVVGRDPLIFVAFDQSIDKESMAKNIQVMGGGNTVKTRLATDSEISADASITNRIKDQQPGRWLVL